jgi:hypothetical protein
LKLKEVSRRWGLHASRQSATGACRLNQTDLAFGGADRFSNAQ